MMTTEKTNTFDFETGVYRPPSEGGSDSLLVRFTRNCPWNHCEFCVMYKSEKFEVRPLDDIKKDIDTIAGLCDQITRHGIPDRKAVMDLIQRHPELNYHHGLSMVFGWLMSGGKTAFIQDADSMIMHSDQMVAALRYLRSTFPSIERVTTYARSRTVSRKKPEELMAIREAGLDRLHMGLESGDDELLKIMRKGVTSQGHIQGGRKAMEAGFQISEYWMPGLGGKKYWEQHAVNTARVLNEINPHYIRSRPFYPLQGTSLAEDVQRGRVELLNGHGVLLELKRMITELEVTSHVCFDHAGNYWRDPRGNLLFTHDYEGYKFPEDKQKVLDRIDEGLKIDNEKPAFLQL